VAAPAPAAAARVVDLFPSDRLTVADGATATGRRLRLPLPSCAAEPATCDEIRLLNRLDGFSVNPRVSLRFSGDIALDTVGREGILILPVWAEPLGGPVALRQLVWDPATRTLFARPERVLLQGRRYALVVTTRLRDGAGRPLERAPGPRDGRAGPLIAAQLARALAAAGLERRDVAAVAVFTTQSVTRGLERIREAIDARPAPALDFALEAGGGRSVYPRAALEGLVLRRQVAAGARPEGGGPLPLGLVPPDAVRAIAFGRFRSASFLGPERVMGDRIRALGHEDVLVTLVLPAGAAPRDGWPVAIFGHGYGGERTLAALALAGTLARQGFATVTMNAVGHGGGPGGELLVRLNGREPVVLPAGGRGADVDGDGQIGATEGLAPPIHGPLALVSLRDGLRQTVADLLQLVRALGRGVDVDGDGRPDLDPARVYYVGQSLGGIYGTLLLAVDPLLRVGVLNAPGGPVVEIARQSPVFRPQVVAQLRARRPSLLNGESDFHEAIPPPGNGPLRVTQPGALALQAYLDRAEWLGQPADPVAYAPYLRAAPLPGVGAKALLVQVALGDVTVPNPTTESLLRAGELRAAASVYRHDRLAPALRERHRDPHGFLTAWLGVPELAAITRAAQEQVARFFLTAGREIARTDPRFELPGGSP
jgi:hypothetical protein